MNIHIAVCDDEPVIAKQLERYIYQYFSNSNDTATIEYFATGEDLIESFHHQFDLIFLDIMMGEKNGVETAKYIRQTGSKVCIVFLTANEEYAREGYVVEAYRFFLKPIHKEYFFGEMSSIISRIKLQQPSNILIKTDKDLYKINIDEINFVEVYNKKCYIKTDNQTIQCNCTLTKMQEQINRSVFFKSHQSYFVNLLKVEAIKDSKEIVLKNGDTIPLSKNRRKDFIDRLTKVLSEQL